MSRVEAVVVHVKVLDIEDLRSLNLLGEKEGRRDIHGEREGQGPSGSG